MKMKHRIFDHQSIYHFFFIGIAQREIVINFCSFVHLLFIIEWTNGKNDLFFHREIKRERIKNVFWQILLINSPLRHFAPHKNSLKINRWRLNWFEFQLLSLNCFIFKTIFGNMSKLKLFALQYRGGTSYSWAF